MEYLSLDKKKDYVIVQMNRPKVNALNEQMVAEIRQTFQTLEKDETAKGVILTGLPNYFSAGLDLIELYNYDKARMREFFIAFGMMHIEMARFTKPYICAITGHSPAGGCVMAIAADYRVMADDPKFTIGLNEIAVNIQISRNLIEAYAYWIGRSKANEFILEGKLLTAQEALHSELVSHICPVDEVLGEAEKKMQQYMLADTSIFKNTKKKLRHNWLTNIVFDEAELVEAMDIWWDPEVRKRMSAFVEFLKNKSKSKVG